MGVIVNRNEMHVAQKDRLERINCGVKKEWLIVMCILINIDILRKSLVFEADLISGNPLGFN